MLKQSHPSKRRNPLIADAFFRLGYIETWGRGFDKIFKEFKTAKMAEPTISEFASGFQISLTRNDKLAVNVPDGRLIRILELLKHNSKMQLMDLARIFSVSKKPSDVILKN
jgi:ATP-dependent DNA helicase RecG